MSIGKKIVSSVVWTALEAWSRQAALFVIFIVLARVLGPEALGLATLAMVLPSILAVLVVKGIPEALIQRPEIDPVHFDSAFWLLATAGAALSVLVWTLAGVIAVAFSEPLLEGLVRLTSVVVAIQALAAVPSAILQRQLNFRLLAFRTLAGTVAGGAVGIGLAIGGHGVWSLIWMQIAKSAVETVVLLLGSAWRPRLRYSHARCRELFGFAGPIVGISLWKFVNDEIPKVVLGAFLGPNEVGIYALARRILDLLTGVFLSPLTTVAMPAVSRLQNDRAKIDRFFDASIRVSGLVGFPAFMGLAAIAPVAVPLILGERWETGVPAIQILMLLGLVRTIDSLCAGTVLALGHSGLVLKLNMAFTVLEVILIGAAAQISLEATMAALVVCNLVLLPVFLFFAQRIANIDVLRPLAIFPRLATITALMFAAVTAWQLAAPEYASQPIVIACGIVIGAAVYCAAAIMAIRPDVLGARDLLLKLRG